MLTYTLGKGGGQSLYEQLYRHIRSDILAGRLLPGERLPSKRTLAEHLQVSVVTVETAYGQLEAEGYIRAEEKRGYFIADVETPPHPMEPIPVPQEETTPHWALDLATNAPAAEYFPFAAWAPRPLPARRSCGRPLRRICVSFAAWRWGRNRL